MAIHTFPFVHCLAVPLGLSQEVVERAKEILGKQERENKGKDKRKAALCSSSAEAMKERAQKLQAQPPPPLLFPFLPLPELPL